MAGNIYDVISTEELNRGERVEMVVDIYESTDGVRGQEPAVNMEDTSPKTTQQTQHPGSRWYRPAAVCLGLLCVLLLAAITVQGIKFTTEKKQLQKERDEFKKQFSELETFINVPRLRYFNSSFYYISIERKSWEESRQYCIKKGADLVIINSREEQDFINRLRGDRTAWIGLSYSDTKRDWRWVDNTAVEDWFLTCGQQNRYGCCVVTSSEYVPVYYCNSLLVWICEKRIFK